MVTPERIVVLLAPVFAGLSGWVVEIIARYFPGAPFMDRTELTGLFGLGVTAGIAAVLKWLHERSKQNLNQASLMSLQPAAMAVESDPGAHAPEAPVSGE